MFKEKRTEKKRKDGYTSTPRVQLLSLVRERKEGKREREVGRLTPKRGAEPHEKGCGGGNLFTTAKGGSKKRRGVNRPRRQMNL